MMRATIALMIFFAAPAAIAAEPQLPPTSPQAHEKQRPQADPHAKLRKPREEASADRSIRDLRPVTFTMSGLGKTPFAGGQVDVNLIPYVGFGLGYGVFSTESVSGSFIPLFLNFYVLNSNFTPFLELGADFVTVKFESSNSLLSSEFKGTQLIAGGGFEYRFDFGLVARVDAVHFINAKLWVPGLAIGYSLLIF